MLLFLSRNLTSQASTLGKLCDKMHVFRRGGFMYMEMLTAFIVVSKAARNVRRNLLWRGEEFRSYCLRTLSFSRK